MKKITSIGLLLCLIVGTAQAQSTKLGIRVGGNLASFRGDTNQLARDFGGERGSDFGRRSGLTVGGVLRVGLTDVFSIRTEVAYTQKGATLETTSSTTIDGQSGTIESDLTGRLDYLDIPVLAEFAIPTSGKVEPYLFAGPSVGFELDSEVETETTVRLQGESATETETEDIDVESTDVGAVIGGGAAYVLDSGNSISLDVRFNPSFRSLDSDSPIDVQNDVITVGLEYTFLLD